MRWSMPFGEITSNVHTAPFKFEIAVTPNPCQHDYNKSIPYTCALVNLRLDLEGGSRNAGRWIYNFRLWRFHC